MAIASLKAIYEVDVTRSAEIAKNLVRKFHRDFPRLHWLATHEHFFFLLARCLQASKVDAIRQQRELPRSVDEHEDESSSNGGSMVNLAGTAASSPSQKPVADHDDEQGGSDSEVQTPGRGVRRGSLTNRKKVPGTPQHKNFSSDDMHSLGHVNADILRPRAFFFFCFFLGGFFFFPPKVVR
jgi:hypothetical protein